MGAAVLRRPAGEARTSGAPGTRRSHPPCKTIALAVAAADTTVTEQFAVGLVVVAMVIGSSGAIARFRSRNHHASYASTASSRYSLAESWTVRSLTWRTRAGDPGDLTCDRTSDQSAHVAAHAAEARPHGSELEAGAEAAALGASATWSFQRQLVESS